MFPLPPRAPPLRVGGSQAADVVIRTDVGAGTDDVVAPVPSSLQVVSA